MSDWKLNGPMPQKGLLADPTLEIKGQSLPPMSLVVLAGDAYGTAYFRWWLGSELVTLHAELPLQARRHPHKRGFTGFGSNEVRTSLKTENIRRPEDRPVVRQLHQSLDAEIDQVRELHRRASRLVQTD